MLREIYNDIKFTQPLIALASNEDAEIRNKAINALGDLMRDDKISSTRISDLLTQFIMSTYDADLNVKQSSLRGIIVTIDKCELTEEKINEILECFIINSTNAETSIRNPAMFGANLLIEKNLLSNKNVEKILEFLVKGAQSIWPDTKKNSLYAMGELIKKDKLTIEKANEITEVFVSGAKESDSSVRKYAVIGFIYLTERNMLASGKLEEVLELLKEAINSVNYSSLRHKALVAIKKMMANDLIPENKRQEMLSLVVAQREAGDIFFEGLTALEKAEIADIMDGTFIEKMSNTYAAAHVPIAHSNTRANEFTTLSSKALLNVISHDQLNADQIDEILTLLITKTQNQSIIEKNNALMGIIEVIEKMKTKCEAGKERKSIINHEISENKISEILDVFTIASEDENRNLRNSALLGANLLIKNDLLTAENSIKLFDMFISGTHSIWQSNRINALLGVGELIKRNKLPEEKTAEIVSLYADNSGEFRGNEIEQHILNIINYLVDQEKIGNDKINKILSIFIKGVNALCTIVKTKSLLGIAQLINKGILPVENIHDILHLLLENTSGAHGVRKNALWGLGQLVRLYNVSPEETNTIIQALMVSAKESNETIRQMALSGIITVIEKNKLLPIKTEELLDFLLERVHFENCRVCRTKALVAVKKIVTHGIVPENKVEAIISIFITIRNDGKFIYESISESEKEEIQDIIDGSTIDNLKARCTSITFFMKEAESEDKLTQLRAMQRIAVLIHQSNNYLERPEEIFAFLINKARDSEVTIKIEAFAAINELIIRTSLFDETLEEVQGLFIAGIKNQNVDLKIRALYGFVCLIEKNKLPAEILEKVLKIFIVGGRSINTDIKKKSILGIKGLIERNKVSVNKIEEVIDLLLSLANDPNADIRLKVIEIINILLERNKLPIKRINEVTKIYLKATDDSISRKAVIVGIKAIIKQNIRSINEDEKIIAYLIECAKDSKIDIRKIALLAINMLIEQASLPISKVEEILKLYIILTNNEKTIKNALLGIRELAKQNRITIENSDSVVDHFLEKLNHINIETQNEWLLIISILVESNKFPINKSEALVDTLREQIESVNCNHVRHNAIILLRKLLHHSVFPKSKAEPILYLLTAMRDQGAFIFEGITESEREELADIIDGSLLEILTTICTTITFFMKKAADEDASVMREAMRQIVALLHQDKVAIEELNELLIFLINKTKDQDSIVKALALAGINALIINNALTTENTTRLFSVFISEQSSLNREVQEQVFYGISNLIEKGTLDIAQLEEIVDSLITGARENIIRKSAILGIRELIIRRKLPFARHEEIVGLLIASAHDEDYNIKINALISIQALVDQDQLPISEAVNIFKFLIERIANENNLNARDILNDCLRKFFKQDSIYNAMNQGILRLLINEASNAVSLIKKNITSDINPVLGKSNFLTRKLKQAIRLSSNDVTGDASVPISPTILLGINILIENSVLTENLIEALVNMLIECINNTQGETRKHAVYGIGLLIEKHFVSKEKQEEIFYLFMKVSRENDVVIRTNMLYVISSIFVNNNEIGSKYAEVAMHLFMEAATDFDSGVRTNALFGIAYFVEANLFLTDKIEIISEIFFTGAHDANINNKNISLYGIIALIKNTPLSLEKAEQITGLLMIAAKDSDPYVSNAALVGIIELIKQKNLPLKNKSLVLNLFTDLSHCEEDALRLKVYFGIVELMEREALSIENDVDFFTLLLRGVQDRYFRIVETTLFGVFVLINKYELSQDITNDIFNLLVKTAHHATAGNESVWMICTLIIRGVLPENNLICVVTLLKVKLALIDDGKVEDCNLSSFEKIEIQKLMMNTLKVLGNIQISRKGASSSPLSFFAENVQYKAEEYDRISQSITVPIDNRSNFLNSF